MAFTRHQHLTMTAISRHFWHLVIGVICISGAMRLNGATGDGINIRFMIENSGGMQDRDIAKTSAALLAAEIDDFLRNPSGQNVIVPTNLRILVDTFWQKDNDVKTEGIFDFRLGQSGRQNYKGLREWSNKWFVNREVTLDKLVNRNWPTDNKNTIPFETRSPFITSGIRIGTPALTTRGFKEEDMVIIGGLIADIVFNGEDAVERVKAEVAKLTEKYPLYPED